MTYTTTGDSQIWVSWSDTSTTTSSTCGSTWDSWNSTCSGTSATTSTTMWRVWVNGEEQHDVYSVPIYKPRKQTKAEKLAAEKNLRVYEEEQMQRKIRAKARAEEKKKAEKRATDLLLDMIGGKELAVYNETGRLFVKGNKYDWIIKKGGILTRIEKNVIQDICIHLDNRYKYPETDNVVAMKLLIEHEEDKVCKIGNEHCQKPRPAKLPLAACM